MPTYLLTWNPDKWEWVSLQQDIVTVAVNGFLDGTWSCGLNKGIRRGDRVFLHRQGVEPRGIFASGHATSGYFSEPHWDAKRAAQGKKANYIRLRFDHLFDPDDLILPRSELGRLGNMYWDTQMSGTYIPDNVAERLELEWADLLKETPAINEFEPHAVEGLVTETVRYTRGRSGALRQQALERANGICAVCDVDYKKVLHGKGVRVLQVHHLKQIASSDSPRVTKLSDLAVVCANCHMLIHSNPFRALPLTRLRKALGRA